MGQKMTVSLTHGFCSIREKRRPLTLTTPIPKVSGYFSGKKWC